MFVLTRAEGLLYNLLLLLLVLRILDALSATGLRAIRYALEVTGRPQITANDIDPRAVEAIQLNSALNNVSDRVVPVCSDAAMLMHKSSGEQNRYHVVDIDPYGSPTQFLDAAVQAVENGGEIGKQKIQLTVTVEQGIIQERETLL